VSKFIVIFFISTLLTSPVSAEPKSTSQSTLESALVAAQQLITLAIENYELDFKAINDFVITQENKFGLKNLDRLKIIKQALVNSDTIQLVLVDNSPNLTLQRRECSYGTDAMVNKNKPDFIYICPQTLFLKEPALAQVLVHELIHTSEDKYEFNECETAWSEYLGMHLTESGNPYEQAYYHGCGFSNEPHKDKASSIRINFNSL